MYCYRLARFSMVALVGFVISQQTARSSTVAIHCDVDNPRIQFAVGDLQSALRQQGFTIDINRLDAPQSAELNFVVAVESSVRKSSNDELKPEGYRIEVEGKTYRAIGRDDGGAMYGGLELAEVVRIGGLKQLQPHLVNPYMQRRGTGFNVPLDARTPSYDDTGDPAQKNIETVWDVEFWQAFLDDPVRHRYDVLSLWSTHPYPSIIRLKENPDVARGITASRRLVVFCEDDEGKKEIVWMSPVQN